MTDITVVVQARLSSSRLPAKTMLSFGGVPLISMIAARLKSDKFNLIFAVPTGSEGKILSNEILKGNSGAQVFAGSLNNVLERFYFATSQLSQDDIIIRLTSDNILPDVDFILELVRKYDGGYSYASINDLVYGASSEIFKKKHLDEAYHEADSDFDKEHVTPYIRRKFSKRPIDHECVVEKPVRFTLDTFDDYLAMQPVMEKFGYNPTVPWKSIVEVIAQGGKSIASLVLGTVQFGVDYGINNQSGKPSSGQVRAIFARAVEAGITTIDTAAAYGNAEELIGENADILTDARICSKLSPYATPDDVDAGVRASLDKLGRSHLDYLMLHNFDQYRTEIWDRLLRLKEQGLIARLGASIYAPDQTKRFEDDIDILQQPFNILDQRWNRFHANKNNIEIHGRSLYLQGLLLNDKLLAEKGFGHVSGQLDTLMKSFERTDRKDLLVAYARSVAAIDKVVIGVDNLAQLEENLPYFDRPFLDDGQLEEVRRTFVDIPDTLVDIRKWA